MAKTGIRDEVIMSLEKRVEEQNIQDFDVRNTQHNNRGKHLKHDSAKEIVDFLTAHMEGKPKVWYRPHEKRLVDPSPATHAILTVLKAGLIRS